MKGQNMKHRLLPLSLVLLLSLTGAFSLAAGDGASVIQLPAPKTEGGIPLMKAISQRRTARRFKSDEIPLQTLSTLLYAAWGISSPDGKRTIPTARNRQNFEVFVLLPSGCYRYDAKNNALVLTVRKDLRGLAFMRPAMPLSAPLSLVYVGKNAGMPAEFDHAHAGSAYQDVYLFCASEGLSTVVCAAFDKKKMTEALELEDGMTALYTQIIGFPAD